MLGFVSRVAVGILHPSLGLDFLSFGGNYNNKNGRNGCIENEEMTLPRRRNESHNNTVTEAKQNKMLQLYNSPSSKEEKQSLF